MMGDSQRDATNKMPLKMPAKYKHGNQKPEQIKLNIGRISLLRDTDII